MAELRADLAMLAAQGSRDARTLHAAMHHGAVVSFDYDGKFRMVEAHAIGLSTKDSALVMRGYQVAGEASRALPQWTLFRLDKIENLTVTTATSHAPREGYAQGDKQMTVLSEIAL